MSPTTSDATSTALVVHERIRVLVDRLALSDSRVRRGSDDGIHKMRVTLRRLRSLLATFAPLYDESAVASLRAELKWVAEELGDARDVEMIRARLTALVSTDEQREVVGRIDGELAGVEAAAREDAVAALDSDRYSALLRVLTGFVTDPPCATRTTRPVEKVALRRVRREWRRLRSRVARVDEADDQDGRKEALHEVRKAAKRLRYAAETLTPSYGTEAARLARCAKRMQTDLGDIQDHAVTREMLRDLAAQPGREAHDAFVLGALHADEDPGGGEAEERYAESWAALAKKKNRRWLT